MHAIKIIVIALAATWLSSGCATQTRLDPAPTVKTLDPKQAVKEIENVRVTANADAWPGLAEVVEHVTPIKVTIRNGNSAAIKIGYNLFALVGSSGSRYAALPPYKIEGTATTAVITGPYTDYAPPRFYHRGFRFAYPYGSIYPGWPVNRHAYYFDPDYYDRYYRYWETVSLPTREMLSEALVEGEIDPGGEVAGFIYFEPVDIIKETDVTFDLNLVTADDGTALGTVTIPFIVDK